MNIAIVYKTLLGTTKKYAYWLAESVDADVYTFNEVTNETLTPYQIIIVCSGTYASGMPLVKFLTSHWDTIQQKKIFAVAVGIIPQEDTESKKAYNVIPDSIKKHIFYVKLPGKLFKPGRAGEPSKEKLIPLIQEIKSTHINTQRCDLYH